MTVFEYTKYFRTTYYITGDFFYDIKPDYALGEKRTNALAGLIPMQKIRQFTKRMNFRPSEMLGFSPRSGHYVAIVMQLKLFKCINWIKNNSDRV